MHGRKNSSKKRKKGGALSNFFLFSILFVIPFVYKVYISHYIRNIINKTFEEKPTSNYKKIKEVYSLLFDKYHLQILLPLLLVYNYYNIFKTFILLMSVLFTLVISEILNLFLVHEIKDQNEIKNELLFNTGYSLVLWHLVFNSEPTRPKSLNSSRSVESSQKSQKAKIYTSLFLIIIIIVYNYAIYFLLISDLDKIIFDAVIGLMIYFIIFHIFKLDVNSPRLFKKIIDINLSYYFLGVLFLNLFIVILYVNVKNNNKQKIDIIEAIIYKISTTSMVMGVIMGAKYEYNYYLEKKLNIWSQYNFETDYEISDAEEEESLTSIISSNTKRQWNYTSGCISVLRLFFAMGITCGCLYSFLFLNFGIFILNIFVKYILPLNLFGFGLFYWYKIILKYLKVTNIFLLTSFRESF